MFYKRKLSQVVGTLNWVENSVVSYTDRIIGKNWGLHGGEYEEWRLLGCYTVALLRTEVSEEFSASFIKVTRIGEIGTTLAVISNRLKDYVGC
jgi:hypothetical protein